MDSTAENVVILKSSMGVSLYITTKYLNLTGFSYILIPLHLLKNGWSYPMGMM